MTRDNLFTELRDFDDEMLETINREFFKRVLERHLHRMKEEISEEERIRLLNE